MQRSSDGQLVQCCVAAVNEVIQLALNVIQQCRCAHPEQVRLCPFVAELVLHKRQPHQGVLSAANASSRFEADFEVGSLIVVANSANLDIE